MITSVTPDKGDPSGRVFVAVHGRHLDSVRSVTVAGRSRPFRTPEDVAPGILVRVPALHVGAYQVVVKTSHGVSARTKRSEYDVVASPWAAVSPRLFGTRKGSLAAAVGCSQTACYVVGNRFDKKSRLFHPAMVTRAEGSRWHEVHLAGASGQTYGAVPYGGNTIACANRGICAATTVVIANAAKTPGLTSFAVGSGEHWKISSAPLPADAANVEDWNLACRSDKCVAFGSYATSDGTSRRLVVETYAHGAWTLHDVPGTVTVDPQLIKYRRETGAVACPTTSTCIGVARLANDQPVAVTVDLDSSAPATVVPLPVQLSGDDTAARMTGIACPTAGRCIAIGDAYHLEWDVDDEQYFESHFHSFAEVYDSGTWSAVDLPLPAGARPYTVTWAHAIDCASTGVCYAVGAMTQHISDAPESATVTRFTSSGIDTVFAAQPDRYRGMGSLYSVDCASGSTCTAFGTNEEILSRTDGPWIYTGFSVHLGTRQRSLDWNVVPSGGDLVGSPACRTPSRCVIGYGYDVFEK